MNTTQANQRGVALLWVMSLAAFCFLLLGTVSSAALAYHKQNQAMRQKLEQRAAAVHLHLKP